MQRNLESQFLLNENDRNEIAEEVRKENFDESVESVVVLFEMVYRIGLLRYDEYHDYLGGVSHLRNTDDYTKDWFLPDRF